MLPKRAALSVITALGLLTWASTVTQSHAQGTAPVAELAGTYIGYVNPSEFEIDIRDSVSPPPSPLIPNQDLGARIDMAVTSTGAVTARLSFGPTVIALRGALTVNNGQADLTLRIPITTFNRTFEVTFNPSTHVSSFGTLAYGTGTVLQQGPQLAVYKNTWVGGALPSYMTAYQTFSIFRGKSLSNSPQGTGFGSIRSTGTSGGYTIAGTLADGQKFATAGFYGPTGQFLIYQYLYANLGGGVVLAPGTINASQAPAIAQEVAQTSVSANTTWIKRPSPRITTRPATWKRFQPRTSATTASADTLYPEGFYMFSGLEGGAYTPPPAGQLLPVVGLGTEGPPASILATIYFGYGSRLNGVSAFTQNFTITNPSSTSTANVTTLATPIRNSTSLTQFDVSTGLFKGTFTLTPPLRPATFEGMLVRRSGNNTYQGYGYFIIRDLLRIVPSIDVPMRLSDQRVSGSVNIGLIEE